jgi:hypothetical protein
MAALRDQQGTTTDVGIPIKTDQWDRGSRGPAQTPSAPIDIAPALEPIPSNTRNVPPTWALSPDAGGSSALILQRGPLQSLIRSDTPRTSSMHAGEASTVRIDEDFELVGEASRFGMNDCELDAVLGTHAHDSHGLHQHNHIAEARADDCAQSSAPRLLLEHQKQEPRQRAVSMLQAMHMQPSKQEAQHHTPSRTSWAASSEETRLRGHASSSTTSVNPVNVLPHDSFLPNLPLTVGQAQISKMEHSAWKSQLPLPPDQGPSRLLMAADGSREGAIRGNRSSSLPLGAVQGHVMLVRYPTIPPSGPAVTGSSGGDIAHVTPSHIGRVPWTGYATRSTSHEAPACTGNQPTHSGMVRAASSNVGPCVSDGNTPVSTRQEARASVCLSQRPSIMDQLKQAKEGLAAVLQNAPLGEAAAFVEDPEYHVGSSVFSHSPTGGPILMVPSMDVKNPRQRHEDPGTLHAVGPSEPSHVSRNSVGEWSQAGPFQMPVSGQLQPVDAASTPIEQVQEQRGLRGPSADGNPIYTPNRSPERLVPSPMGMTTPSNAIRDGTGSLGRTPQQRRAPRQGLSRSFAVAQSTPTEKRLRGRQSALLVNLRMSPPISSHGGGPSDGRRWEPERVSRGSHTHGRQAGQAQAPQRGFTLPIGRSDMHGLPRAETGPRRSERDSRYGREQADAGQLTCERFGMIAREMPESGRSLTDRLDHTLSQIEGDLASLSLRMA